MKILRSILAVVIGLFVSMVMIMAVHMIGQAIYPLPDGVDPNDMAKLRELIPTMPIGALLLVVLAWESGAFVGGAVAALIAGWARCVHAGIIGGLVLAATIANIIMLQGHPNWMIIAGLVLPLPVSLLAGKIVSGIFPPVSPSIGRAGLEDDGDAPSAQTGITDRPRFSGGTGITDRPD